MYHAALLGETPLFFKSILLLFFDCNSDSVSLCAWVTNKGWIFAFYFTVRCYTPTLYIAAAWAKWISLSQSYCFSAGKVHLTSLGKLIRRERFFGWYWVWNINHCSYREEKYICICIFPLPQMSHLSKEEYMGSKTISCLPVDKTAIARPTCTTLWLTVKKPGHRPTPWENKNSP